MTNANDQNHGIIGEFRSNEGKVGGGSAGRPLLLLATSGAKTGKLRTNPLMYLMDGDRWIVFASRGGAPNSPAWFHNLVANPVVTVEVGTEAFEGLAKVVICDERDRLHARQAELYSQFGEYQSKTTRKMPVIALTCKQTD